MAPGSQRGDAAGPAGAPPRAGADRSSGPGTGDVPGLVRIRVVLPHQLRHLARVTGEAVVRVAPPVTLGTTLDALEATHPGLAGTIRDRDTGARRPMIRIYAVGEDYSDAGRGTPLPGAVVDGSEPLRLVGSIAGG